MGILDSVLKVFVGDKSKKDIKEIQPKVDLIKKAEKTLENLSHDELRAKTIEFKQKINEARKDIYKKIEELQEQANTTEDIDEKEDIYAEIDKLKDESFEAAEKVLNEILPEAFVQIVKIS